MQRIANGTQVAALPDMLASVGTPGYATDGDPAGGFEATIFDAGQYNILQEELVSVVVAAGITLSRSDRGQVLAAIRAMFAPSVMQLGGSGNFVVPAGVTKIKVTLCGGGGGGGGSNGNSSAGSGGGGGARLRGVLIVTPGQSIAYAVGGGGVRGNTSGGGGGGGGATTFGALTAGGGIGGFGATAGVIATNAGDGGGATGSATEADPGLSGGTGYLVGGGGIVAGGGGASPGFSPPGPPNSSTSVAQAGGDAVYPGCGAPGGVSGGNGGLGGPGRILVEW
jgi:hypothetical protein